jgi:exopolyphosphatase/guanosine-5'-triphosphate,3'-diphosphate pyrophosphatase
MTPRAITLLRDHIGSVISVIISDMQGFPYTRIFGSSGTILALESVASEHPPLADDHKPGILTMSEIDYIVRYLSSLTLAERRRVPGLNPNRADIIIAGAVLLQALLEASGHQEIRTSDRGLIYGLVEETLAKTNDNRIPDTPLGRYHAVTGLGNKFHLDTKHARHVMNLAIMLFDSGKEIGLHNLSDTEREILIHAAYLHDIGSIISFSRHHHHSYYIISSSSMAAFSQEELRMIGLVARYHRKKPPRNRDAVLVHLHRNERRIVHILTQILRMAESLDRTHDMRVESVRFVRIPGSQEILEIFSSQDCTMETIACQETAAGFEKVFHRPLAIIQAGNHHAPASLAESGQI